MCVFFNISTCLYNKSLKEYLADLLMKGLFSQNYHLPLQRCFIPSHRYCVVEEVVWIFRWGGVVWFAVANEGLLCRMQPTARGRRTRCSLLPDSWLVILVSEHLLSSQEMHSSHGLAFKHHRTNVVIIQNNKLCLNRTGAVYLNSMWVVFS